MYFPILRGRQYELIAVRTCIEKELISSLVIPIIEPVKASSGMNKLLKQAISSRQYIGIVRNPVVGDWDKEIELEKNKELKNDFESYLKSEYVYSVWYVNDELPSLVVSSGIENFSKSILIVKNPSEIDICKSLEKQYGCPAYTLIPDQAIFRRQLRKNSVVCEDRFRKEDRNSDYKEGKGEFFSADHAFFKDDNFVGFSDYSIVGDEYSEAGFAPYAVVIHIVYLNSQDELYVRHFVSDSNSDIHDPACKYEEALKKLYIWHNDNPDVFHMTYGFKEFLDDYKTGRYPGLGVVKKNSIMHHLELINHYLKKDINENM